MPENAAYNLKIEAIARAICEQEMLKRGLVGNEFEAAVALLWNTFTTHAAAVITTLNSKDANSQAR